MLSLLIFNSDLYHKATSVTEGSRRIVRGHSMSIKPQNTDMNSKKACERIKRIEKKYYKKFYINEINFWPLLRLHLWKYLTSTVIKNKQPNFLIFLKILLKNYFKFKNI